jgi:hypothetical protein
MAQAQGETCGSEGGVVDPLQSSDLSTKLATDLSTNKLSTNTSWIAAMTRLEKTMRRAPLLFLTLLQLPLIATAQTSEVFRDQELQFSFRHPSNWKPVNAQRPSTRVLLYAQDGSEATANVSVVPSDRQRVSEFNRAYFQGTLSKVYKQVTIKDVRYIHVLGNEMAIVESTFTVAMPSESFKARSLAMATIYNGHRYMLIVNGLPDKFSSPSKAFDLMVGTFALF